MTGLIERLRRKTEEDRRLIEGHRKQIERLLRDELRQLTESSRRYVESALRTIERDTGRVVLRAWLRSAAVGLGVTVGIAVGSWGLTQWLTAGIGSRIEERGRLGEEIEAQRRTLEELEAKTWGIQLRELDNGNFVVLPRAGALDGTDRPLETGWSVDGRPAVKLSRR